MCRTYYEELARAPSYCYTEEVEELQAAKLNGRKLLLLLGDASCCCWGGGQSKTTKRNKKNPIYWYLRDLSGSWQRGVGRSDTAESSCRLNLSVVKCVVANGCEKAHFPQVLVIVDRRNNFGGGSVIGCEIVRKIVIKRFD